MWIAYSIVAAVLWGLDYALAEKVLTKIRFSTLLSIEFFFGFLVMFGFSLLSGTFKTELASLVSSKQTIGFLLVMMVAFIVAHVLIVLSIEDKNATLAGLIEISYPLFIALFSWLLFRETNLNMGTAFGGILILFGASLVYFFNR
jgi:drug/metabolite transporter (DMT)-like permease